MQISALKNIQQQTQGTSKIFLHYCAKIHVPFIANAIILDRQDPRAKLTCKVEWFLGASPVVSFFHIQSHTSLAGAHNIYYTSGKLVCHHFHAELQVANH